MKNFGIAQVKVELLNGLPNVAPLWKKYNFDVGAFDWNAINNSPVFKPVLVEEVHDQEGGFAALFPSRRVFPIDNFMSVGEAAQGVTASSAPYITWTPVDAAGIQGAFNDIINDETLDPPYDMYNGEVPVNPQSGSPDGWLGPVWKDNFNPKEPFPNDLKVLNEFYKAYGVDSTVTSACLEAATTKSATVANTCYINQTVVRSGLWWAVRSNNFLSHNMPFWVLIKKPRPPTSANLSSFVFIRFGQNDENNQFDIWLGNNMKPRIIDYALPSQTTGTATATASNSSTKKGLQIEFNESQSMLLSTGENILVGVMTIAGRLIVQVNGISYVYTRPNKDPTSDGGGLLECKIPAGGVDIYGTNIQASINLSPMVFAPQALMVLPIPHITSQESDKSDGMPGKWKGVGYNGGMTSSIALLPTPPSINSRFMELIVVNLQMKTGRKNRQD